MFRNVRFFWFFLLLNLCWIGTSYIACGPTKVDEVVKEQTQTEPAQKDAGQEPTISPDSSDELVIDSQPDANNHVEVNPEPQPEPQPESQHEKVVKEQEPTDTIVEKQPRDQGSQSFYGAWVTNSNFVAGSYSLMSVGQRKKILEKEKFKTSVGTFDLSGDLVLRLSGNRVVMLNRFNNPQKKDRMDVFMAQTGVWSAQFSFDPKSNPHDAVYVNSRYFISQYDKKSILVVEKNRPNKTIDLSSLAEKSSKACTKDADCEKFGAGSKKCNAKTSVCESDGIPEMSKMLLVGDKIYVLVQGLDRNDGFKPIKSVIAVIDTKGATLVKSLPLKGSNPSAFIKEPSGSYLVVELGSAFDPTDGGLERFEPKTETLSNSYVLTEKEMGGAFSFGGIVIVSSTIGYALINDAKYNQSLVQFDPSTGKKGKELLKGKKLSGLAVNKLGELYVGDKGDGQGGGSIGVRIFDAKSGKELTTTPIPSSHKLPPSGFIFTDVSSKVVPKP